MELKFKSNTTRTLTSAIVKDSHAEEGHGSLWKALSSVHGVALTSGSPRSPPPASLRMRPQHLRKESESVCFICNIIQRHIDIDSGRDGKTEEEKERKV